MKSILLLFHCGSNTGFAIETLEEVFFGMANELVDGDRTRIHIGYPDMDKGVSSRIPADFRQYVIVDTASKKREDHRRVFEYLVRHEVDTVFGFDQPVSRPMYSCLRRAGVRRFVSYWGAPMSSLNRLHVRVMKRLQVALAVHGPNHYIFESQGMAQTAILGRGIPPGRVDVVYLGVDHNKYRPEPKDAGYVYEQMGIKKERRIFFYSGHMEQRKGVRTIVRAAKLLSRRRSADDWHIVLFGNTAGEESALLAELRDDARALDHVTFGGYRNDLERIHRGCYAGIIASTGWDSLTMSSIEMQSSGLPLLLSDLPGLNEAIEANETGFLFPPGDACALAATMEILLDDRELRDTLSTRARQRVHKLFTREAQHRSLVTIMSNLSR